MEILASIINFKPLGEGLTLFHIFLISAVVFLFKLNAKAHKPIQKDKWIL